MGLALERLDPSGETRQLACNHVLIHYASRRTALQLRLRHGERGARLLLIAGRDREFDGLEGTADAVHARPIDDDAARGLPYSFFRRFMRRHLKSVIAEGCRCRVDWSGAYSR